MQLYGQGITYDEIGNPLSYRGMNFTWAGRRLTKTEIGSDTISYTYNIDGIRTSKTVGTETTEYFLEGSTVIAQKTGNNVLWFLYDADGQRIGFTYNGTPYLYVYNATGDVVGIVDDTLTMVVEYTYSPWGEILSTTGDEANTIGVINSFRYRGYYYDEETGLYYLNARYYDPETGRFINADGQLNNDILGNNLFIYCGNNPIMRADDGGQGWWVVAGILVGAVVSAIIRAVSNVNSNENWYSGVVGASVGGGIGGGLAASGQGSIGIVAGAAAESITNEILSYTPAAPVSGLEQKSLTKENVSNSIGNILTNTFTDSVLSTVSGKIAGNLIPTNKGWFKPKKFLSSFFGKYARKAHLQTFVDGVFNEGFAQAWQALLNDLQQEQESTVVFYPDTQIQAVR